MAFPGFFHRRSTAKRQEKDDVTETVRTLIEARFDRLESNFLLLRNEWADVHEKLMLLYDRTRKRVKAAEKVAEGEQPVTEVLALPTRESVLREWKSRNGVA